jgi:hypothetical protein
VRPSAAITAAIQGFTQVMLPRAVQPRFAKNSRM